MLKLLLDGNFFVRCRDVEVPIRNDGGDNVNENSFLWFCSWLGWPFSSDPEGAEEEVVVEKIIEQQCEQISLVDLIQLHKESIVIVVQLFLLILLAKCVLFGLSFAFQFISARRLSMKPKSGKSKISSTNDEKKRKDQSTKATTTSAKAVDVYDDLVSYLNQIEQQQQQKTDNINNKNVPLSPVSMSQPLDNNASISGSSSCSSLSSSSSGSDEMSPLLDDYYRHNNHFKTNNNNNRRVTRKSSSCSATDTDGFQINHAFYNPSSHSTSFSTTEKSTEEEELTVANGTARTLIPKKIHPSLCNAKHMHWN